MFFILNILWRCSVSLPRKELTFLLFKKMKVVSPSRAEAEWICCCLLYKLLYKLKISKLYHIFLGIYISVFPPWHLRARGTKRGMKAMLPSVLWAIIISYLFPGSSHNPGHSDWGKVIYPLWIFLIYAWNFLLNFRALSLFTFVKYSLGTWNFQLIKIVFC